MIDPFTAFAVAQGAVKGIKAAIQLGKDVNGLYSEFSTFFQSADEVHRANIKMRMESLGKSDAQLSDMSLQIALRSKQLRDNEKELKKLLIYSGNGDVWEEMLKERIRMIKERAAAERAIADKKQRDREAIGQIIMLVMYFIGGIAIAIPTIIATFYMLTHR